MTKYYTKDNKEAWQELNRFLSMYENQSQAAEALGVTRSYLNQVVNSIAPLSCRIAKRIQRVTQGEINAAILLGDKKLYIPHYKSFREHFIAEYIYPMADTLSLPRSEYFAKYTHYDVKAIFEKPLDKVNERDIKLLAVTYFESVDYLKKIIEEYL